MTGLYRGDPQFREVRRENCQEVVTVLSFLSDLPPVAVWPASHSSADPLDCPGLKPAANAFCDVFFVMTRAFSKSSGVRASTLPAYL